MKNALQYLNFGLFVACMLVTIYAWASLPATAPAWVFLLTGFFAFVAALMLILIVGTLLHERFTKPCK